MHFLRIGLLTSALILTSAGFISFAHADFSLVEHQSLWGKRNYRLYVPPTVTHGNARYLVVALHGCKQNSADFAAMTQLNQAADRAQFVVLYPEQDVKRFGQCWEWFAPSNQRPAEGEPAIIVDLVKKIAETFHLSRPQTFVMGFSAGGAFASTLATCYSDRFAAAAIHSGIPYAATDELSEIFSVLAGNYASEAYLEKTKIAVSELGDKGLPVPTISLHGTLDKTVNPDNQIKLVKQALLSHHLLAPQERVDLIAASGGDYDDVYSLMTKVYGVVSTRRELVRMVSVFGLGHAWSGGPADSNFSENNAPDATGIFLKFFEAQLPGGLCEKEFRPH